MNKDLIAFLLARFAEDDATVEGIAGGGDIDDPLDPDGVRQDRLIKRRMIELSTLADEHDGWPPEDRAQMQAMSDRMLRVLARPYSAHPDYRDDWRLDLPPAKA